MTTFTVWKFDDVGGAEQADSIIKAAAAEGIIEVVDSAYVRWDADAKKPTTHQAHEDTWRDTGWGALWGVLFGVLFFIPLIGAAVGAAAGALTGAFDGVGIRKEDIEKIREEVKPGTSALFVVTDNGDLDRLAERFHGLHAKLIDGSLTSDEAKILRDTFES